MWRYASLSGIWAGQRLQSRSTEELVRGGLVKERAMKHSGSRGTRRAAVVVATITFTLIFGAGASVAGATPGNGNGNVNANPNSNAGGNGPHADDPNQVPSGSNGVNHNDPPLPANLDCTNTAGTSGTCSVPQPPSSADLNNT